MRSCKPGSQGCTSTLQHPRSGSSSCRLDQCSCLQWLPVCSHHSSDHTARQHGLHTGTSLHKSLESALSRSPGVLASIHHSPGRIATWHKQQTCSGLRSLSWKAGPRHDFLQAFQSLSKLLCRGLIQIHHRRWWWWPCQVPLTRAHSSWAPSSPTLPGSSGRSKLEQSSEISPSLST